MGPMLASTARSWACRSHAGAQSRGHGRVSRSLLAWLLLALLAPILPLEDPNTVLMDRKLQAPSWTHPFGTDDVGRDLVSRVIYGVTGFGSRRASWSSR